METTKTTGKIYNFLSAYVAHILIPCGKKYEGKKDMGKQNPGHPCLKDNKNFPLAKNMIEKTIVPQITEKEDNIQISGCECNGVLNKKPFLGIEAERSGNASICRIKLYCEKEEHLDLFYKAVDGLYKGQNGDKSSIVFYKIKDKEKIILDKDITKIIKTFSDRKK